jgi:hypothetical protein
MPLRQCRQVWSLIAKGATTKSPGRMVRTSDPTSSTTPAISCPMRRGRRVGLIPRYGHRSEPQTQVAVVRTTASVGR